MTRSGSPDSSAGDQDNADWTFARREVAFARLGLDPALDSLPDDDLNKLFHKIAKVKTARDRDHAGSISRRPESSMSLSVSGSQSDVWGGKGDDAWSETGPGETTTDDTSVHEAEQLKDVQNQLENRLQGIKHEDSPEAEDLRVEKEHMEHQLRLVKNQMKRMIDARSRGETEFEGMDFEPVIYSARQLRLIRKVLDKWRAHQAFSMAEVVLSNAVLIKEANIIRCAVHCIFSMQLTHLSPLR